jgi:hypothetical protein
MGGGYAFWREIATDVLTRGFTLAGWDGAGVALSGVPGAAQHEAKRNDALLTPISGLPEIGTHIRASRVNPTCVDR